MSPDSKVCFSCCSDGNIAVWDLHNQTLVRYGITFKISLQPYALSLPVFMVLGGKKNLSFHVRIQEFFGSVGRKKNFLYNFFLHATFLGHDDHYYLQSSVDIIFRSDLLKKGKQNVSTLCVKVVSFTRFLDNPLTSLKIYPVRFRCDNSYMAELLLPPDGGCYLVGMML